MKIYKPFAIVGLYLMSLNPLNPQVNMDYNADYNRHHDKHIDGDVSKKNSSAKKHDYTFVVNVGEFNPTAGIDLRVIHNKDTTNAQTNYTGIALFQAYPGDTVNFYPTKKSGKFKNLEVVLNDTSFNIINLSPDSL